MPKKKFLIYLLALIVSTMHAESEWVTNGFVSSYVPPSLKATEVDPPRPGQRLFNIYIPDGYDTSSERYPVVYWMHGLGGDFESFASIQDILDELIAAHEIMPMLVVKIDASAPPAYTGAHLGGTWYVNSTYPDDGQFEQYIVQELVPYVDANYRTKSTTETLPPGVDQHQPYRTVMGQSMGGFGALHTAIKHPELFVGGASESGTPFWVQITTLAAERVPPKIPPTYALVNPDYQYHTNPLMYYRKGVYNEVTQALYAGKIVPQAGENTQSLVSYAQALSPNGSLPLGADYPFITQIIGSDQVLPKNAANVYMMNPDSSVIAQWQINDPYTWIQNNIAGRADTAKGLNLYLDGGAREPANCSGARILSDLMTQEGINHEYLVYNGEHTRYLEEPFSRIAAGLKRFSAQFAGVEQSWIERRSRLVGNFDIEFWGDATLDIADEAVFSIETDPITNPHTDITLHFYDQSALVIGTQAARGGVFEVGNLRTKALDVQYDGNTVSCFITLEDKDAYVQIGKGGMLGFAAGITGKG